MNEFRLVGDCFVGENTLLAMTPEKVMMTNGWQTVELGKVMQLEIDAVLVDAQPEFPMAGVYSFARGLFKREVLPNTQTTYKFFHRLHKDMYVISVPKGWEGALARVTDDFDGMFLSPVFPTFRANSKELDIQYLEWYCRQSKVWEELRRKSRGIGARRESVSAQQFLTLEIPLPPLTEQRRIVAHIESLAARVNEAQRLREEADLDTSGMFASVLNQTFEKLEKEYPPCEIQNICTVIRGGSPRPAGDMRFYDGDFPFTKVADITKDEHMYMLDTVHTLTELGTQSSRLAKSGTILLTVSGATLGVPKIVKIDAYFNDGIVAFPNLSDEVFAEYFYYFLKSRTKWFRDYNARGQGLPNLNTDMLRPMKFPLPPLDEQRRIVAYLDGLQAKVNALRELQSASGEELSALLPSILDKAFRGEL